MLLTAVDDNYLSEASYLIKSCARYEPDQKFFLYLVNSSEDKVKKLKKQHPKLIVEHVTWKYDQSIWKGIMCCARSIPLKYVLESYKEPTIYLDSDTLLRAPLTELFGLLRSYDLSVLYRPDTKLRGPMGTDYCATFNSGVIAIRHNDVCLQFVEEYNKRMWDWIKSGKEFSAYRMEEKLFTCIDQELLYIIYNEYSERLKFVPLPHKFNDSRFLDDSVIWHGKGTARKHPQYVHEKLKYDNVLLSHLFYLANWPRMQFWKIYNKARKKG